MDFLSRISFKQEPAIWIGFIVAVATAIVAAISESGIEWQTAYAVLPIVAGIFTRHFVTPA